MPSDTTNPTPPDVNSGPGLLAIAERINLPLSEIAREAGLNKHTISRLKTPDVGRAVTLAKVRRVVLGHAAGLRQYLDQLPIASDRAA